MSPEELLATVDLGSMEAFKQMDIYSMALVLWEIISRCEVSGKHNTVILAQSLNKVTISRISLGRRKMCLSQTYNTSTFRSV